MPPFAARAPRPRPAGTPEQYEKAPDFELQAEDGSIVRLSHLRGQKVVLYFYPKDDTPGCTKQACGLRDNISLLRDRGARVLGVSPDSVKSHRKFRDKYGLPFTLLADEDHEVAERYGVWKEKSLFGRKYMGVERTTFLIDGEGRIARVFPRVNPETHAHDILEALDASA